MNYVKIGEYIQLKRKAIGITQAELGEKLGVTSKAVSKWECGVALPDVALFLDLCDILNIEVDELLEGKDKVDSQVRKSKIKNITIIIMSFFLIFLTILTIFLGIYYQNNHDNVHVYEITSDNKNFKLNGNIITIGDKSYININNIYYNSNNKDSLYGYAISYKLYYKGKLIYKQNNEPSIDGEESIIKINKIFKTISISTIINEKLIFDVSNKNFLVLKIDLYDDGKYAKSFSIQISKK